MQARRVRLSIVRNLTSSPTTGTEVDNDESVGLKIENFNDEISFSIKVSMRTISEVFNDPDEDGSMTKKRSKRLWMCLM